jgi:hypothetical protein
MDVVKSRRMIMVRFGMSRLSQETLAILGVGVALAALILTDSVGVRGEFQAVRAEARADREAMRADHETFQNHILRLTEQQGILRAHLDDLRDPPATNR